MSIRDLRFTMLRPALVLVSGLLMLGACNRATGTPVQSEGPSGGPLAAAAPVASRQALTPFATPVSTNGSPGVADLVERVSPVVVSITAIEEAGGAEGMELPDPFGFFFKRPEHEGRAFRLPTQQGSGTGLIVDPRGYVLTNDHVVRSARDIRVRTYDNREYRAKLLGHDGKLDLAVLQLEGAKDLPSAFIGSAQDLRVGEAVLAIGSPYGLDHSVTLGIVSAKARNIGAGPYDDFIQTDASINPGNSGGPLFNMKGEVVGINTAIRAGAAGIGFAIPIDDVKAVLDQLEHKGYVDRGKLGLVYQPVDASLATALGLGAPRGALVAEVEKNGPADKAGIHEGDVIVAVAGTPVAASADLARFVASRSPGSKVPLGVVRDGRAITIDATLARLEDHTPAPLATTDAAKAAVPELAGIDVQDEPNGAGVSVVEVSTPHLGNGLEPGDVIVQSGHTAIRSVAELAKALHAMPRSSTALLKVHRDGHDYFVGVQLGG
jgi:serine protease Do